jgi:hypothetical protein
MILPCPVGILAEPHVQHPMLTVLDTPVPAHGLRETLRNGQCGQAEVVGEEDQSWIWSMDCTITGATVETKVT